MSDVAPDLPLIRISLPRATGAPDHQTVHVGSSPSASAVLLSGGAPSQPSPPPRRRLTIDLPELLSADNLRKAGSVVVFWLVLVVLSSAIVCYLVGPLFESRAQVTRTSELRVVIGQAYGAANNSLEGAVAPTRAPLIGDPVALLQIPRLAVQQAVAEGASGRVLRGGAGHVPGTAAAGQPGNSVVVGRQHAFGAGFGRLDELRVGDQLIVQSAQGQTTYAVTAVEGREVTDQDYAPTQVDTLTLLSSASRSPWNSDAGIVVTAELESAPFVPTPQNGYTTEQDGRHGDRSAWPLLILEVLGLLVALATAAALYRSWSRPAAYLVSTPALIALSVFLTLTGSRLLPGWF